MSDKTKIEWCDATFNPWRGCTKVSAGCANCYAETFSGRNPGTLGVWGPNGTRVVAAEGQWREPLKWDRAAAAKGERHRVFCASLADVFEGPETMPADAVQPVNEARARLFSLIQDTPNLDWLLLTKRPGNFVKVLRAVLDTGKLKISETKRGAKHWNVVDWLHGRNFPANVWIGTSVENQDAADERIPHLLAIPAKVRFLSMEPLLGPVDLSKWMGPIVRGASHMSTAALECGACEEGGSLLGWCIVGGESGPKARPMHPDWARSLRDQCTAAGVAFLFKQWGEEVPENQVPGLYRRPIPPHMEGKLYWPFKAGQDFGPCMAKVGKKTAGRLLDGRTWDEFPEARK